MDPLTKSQQALRGLALCDMSIAQLRDWIAACEQMDQMANHKKAPRGWQKSRELAVKELESRASE